MGSRTTGPPYFALKPTSEHSAVAVVAVGLAVVAVVLAVADVVLAVAESVSAVTAYLLQRAGGLSVCHVYSRAAAPAWCWLAAGASGNIPPQMED